MIHATPPPAFIMGIGSGPTCYEQGVPPEHNICDQALYDAQVYCRKRENLSVACVRNRLPPLRIRVKKEQETAAFIGPLPCGTNNSHDGWTVHVDDVTGRELAIIHCKDGKLTMVRAKKAP